MRMLEVIAHKRDGETLSTEEIRYFITEYTAGNIPDYQAAALLMAIVLRGMDQRETVDLTLAMAHSGEVLDLSDVLPVSVDKHSSGGVGDKTTLIVLPMVAACGVPVAKMSGRGLGFTGGTLDKLESIAGYRVKLSMDEFRAIVQHHGVVLAGQSGNLAPADGKLYALRDATATVECLPLIASSIMSKKIAAGANAIVLDVKVGKGAFMKNLDDARQLARLMVSLGKGAGRAVIAQLSDMNQPLGHAVGNAIEVEEAIHLLHGQGAADLHDHCRTVAGHMLNLARHTPHRPIQEAADEAECTLHDGSAFAKFREMVAAQGGDTAMVDDPTLLPRANILDTLTVTQRGFTAEIDAEQVGLAAVELGAGRAKKEDAVDHAVGIFVHKKVGDSVEIGEPLFTIYGNNPNRVTRAKQMLTHAVAYSSIPVAPLPTFYDTISSEDAAHWK